jgi:hypothetical protein
VQGDRQHELPVTFPDFEAGCAERGRDVAIREDAIRFRLRADAAEIRRDMDCSRAALSTRDSRRSPGARPRHSSDTASRHRGECISIRRLTATSNERSGNSSACASRWMKVIARPAARALAGDRQHLLGRIHAGDLGAALSQEQSRAARPGADVQDRPAADFTSHADDHRRLGLGDELPDRPAEAAIVERAGGLWISVNGVAVVFRRHHAARSAHARRVRSR